MQLQDLLDEQEKNGAFFYLIKSENDLIMGRINIVDVDKPQKSAHIGYRVGKSFTGQGVAYTALKMIMEITDELGIENLYAKTTNNNIASQKVLEKNGFEHIETNEAPFIMNAESIKFVYYIWKK